MHQTRRDALALGLAAGVAASFGLGASRAGAVGRVAIDGPQALATALAAAGPGTVLALAPGDYGTLAMQGGGGGQAGGGSATAPVTITAADPAHPPRFDRMALRDASHLVLDGLLFDYTFAAGDTRRMRPFEIAGGQNITLRGTVFDGDRAQDVSEVDDGYGFGFGLSVRGIRGFVLESCEIRDFFNGLHVHHSSDVTIRGNDLHTMRMDGMKFTQMTGLVIEGNHIHDFNRSLESKDHADMIQFFTMGSSAPSRDVVIRGNLLNSGTGWYTQSIFMRNEEVDKGRAGAEMFYQNLLIEDNLIINAHTHGILVGQVAGLTIRRNTVVRNARSQGQRNNPALWTPRIAVTPKATRVRIERNVVADILGYDKQPDWVVADNFLVQDRSRTKPGFYEAVFTGDPADPARFAYRKGGPLDGAGIGVALLQRS